MTKIEGQFLNDMHKVIYLAQAYNDKDIKEISAMVNMTPFDFNGACWHAEDEGFLKIDKKDGKITVLKTPDTWEFGDAIEHLIEGTPYVLKKLNEKEADIEENFFANYLNGYDNHDILIAIKYMLAHKIIAAYTIEDKTEMPGDEEDVIDYYIFYTLPENEKKRFGEKQFKDQSKLEK